MLEGQTATYTIRCFEKKTAGFSSWYSHYGPSKWPNLFTSQRDRGLLDAGLFIEDRRTLEAGRLAVAGRFTAL